MDFFAKGGSFFAHPKATHCFVRDPYLGIDDPVEYLRQRVFQWHGAQATDTDRWAMANLLNSLGEGGEECEPLRPRHALSWLVVPAEPFTMVVAGL